MALPVAETRPRLEEGCKDVCGKILMVVPVSTRYRWLETESRMYSKGEVP